MPVPIKTILDVDYYREDNNRNTVDYSFLSTFQPEKPKSKNVIATNTDASLLFEIWTKSEKSGEDSYRIDSEITSRDILRLKSRGFLTGSSDLVKFTQKGKRIVTTMALGEPNKFAEAKTKKDYAEIMASMDKRGKKGYRIASSPSYAVDNINRLDLRQI